MDRTPMTKEEIALELVKLIAPPLKVEYAASNLKIQNSDIVAKAYNHILNTISNSPKSE